MVGLVVGGGWVWGLFGGLVLFVVWVVSVLFVVWWGVFLVGGVGVYLVGAFLVGGRWLVGFGVGY
ncbi:hypothetical protein, partial [Pseudomonas syringae group genomosp. 7]|uniref:hypothetical protein n=1 Tax=Pseudomonas syringae group genomosp. 7 TaxID=251699 RepID=UPI00377024A5